MTTEAPPASSSHSLEERMARIEAQQEIIIELLRDNNARFDRIDEKFDRMEEKFDRIDERFVRIDEKFDRIDEKFDRIDERFARIDERFDGMTVRIDTINHRIFLAGLGMFTIVGAGVVSYVVSLLV